MTRTFWASSPLRPGATSNSTVSPSFRLLYPLPSMFEKCTNTSAPPSREMKPNPFSALKNLTVPVATLISLRSRPRHRGALVCAAYRDRRKGHLVLHSLICLALTWAEAVLGLRLDYETYGAPHSRRLKSLKERLRGWSDDGCEIHAPCNSHQPPA